MFSMVFECFPSVFGGFLEFGSLGAFFRDEANQPGLSARLSQHVTRAPGLDPLSFKRFVFYSTSLPCDGFLLSCTSSVGCTN